jgi:hypothetical protein
LGDEAGLNVEGTNFEEGRGRHVSLLPGIIQEGELQVLELGLAVCWKSNNA